MVRLARQQYFSDLATNLTHNSCKFWRSFQHLSPRQKAHVTNLDVSCDTINQHFLTVAGKTVADLPSSSISSLSYIDCVDVPDFSLSEVHVDDVFQHIQALDIHKAVGIDEIPTRFVKAAPYGMAVILTTLIKMSILMCTFPDLWKTAIVTPVQKSKQDNSLSNFWPISVLPVASKILERLVFDAMVGHLLKYELLSTEQSGFRPGNSTQDVLLCVTDSWLKAIDDGKYVGAVFLDLAKAFDCVDHEILLKKLTCYGVRGDALKWMQSFLYGRFQRVSLMVLCQLRVRLKLVCLKALFLARCYFPFMLMIFQLPLLLLMSIYMLMIQSCIIVLVTSDNWSAFYSMLLRNFLYGWLPTS